jgi:hypothetical protein
MTVMEKARQIGLVAATGAVTGTIDEEVVLAAIAELAAEHPTDDDLYADAAMNVQLARSAGVVQPDVTSVLHRSRQGIPVQLRYRSEMADVFTDLAIDVGVRAAESLAEV